MTEDVQIIIRYKDWVYNFTSGAEAYIFHTGILNGVDKKHNIDELLNYVSYVFECYLDDDNSTPLGAFADYIAVNWNTVKGKSSVEALKGFYSEK